MTILSTLLTLPVTPKRIRKSLIENKIFKINEEINKITSDKNYLVTEISVFEKEKDKLISEFKKLE